ncbi:DUF551 domain-containing protein [Enterobacter hormaechei]
MSTLTKEWLLTTIAELEEERDATPGAVNEDAEMALAAMKLALASLEAEPVAQVLSSRAGNDTSTIDKALPEGTVLYTAPPAPVSVPEWTNEQCLEFLSIAFRHAEINGDLELDDIRLGVKMVNGSRAAMLQGAEPVSNSDELPDSWVACSERMPKKGQEVLCTDQFENYETAIYDTGYIPGPPFFATTAGEFHPTHWMPLPAAPQQEDSF